MSWSLKGNGLDGLVRIECSGSNTCNLSAVNFSGNDDVNNVICSVRFVSGYFVSTFGVYLIDELAVHKDTVALAVSENLLFILTAGCHSKYHEQGKKYGKKFLNIHVETSIYSLFHFIIPQKGSIVNIKIYLA